MAEPNFSGPAGLESQAILCSCFRGDECNNATMSPNDRAIRRGAARFGMVVVGALAVVGCGGDGSGSEVANDAQGASLYRQSCASCHGTDLRGTARGPSHLSEVYEAGHHPDDSFRSAIERGAAAHHWNFGDMPSVPGLNDDEVDAIIDYIRQQQDAHGLEPYPPD